MADDGNAGTLSPAVAALDLDNNTSSAAAAAAAAASSAHDFFPINNLPTDLLVTIVALAAEQMDIGKRPWDSPKGPTWIRHSFPLVCKRWNAIFATKDASPLHETLLVNFGKEILAAKEDASASSITAAATTTTMTAGGVRGMRRDPRRDPRREFPEFRRLPNETALERALRLGEPFLHTWRVIDWAQQRAESVRKLLFDGRQLHPFTDFTPNDLAALVDVVGPHLEEIDLGRGFGRLPRSFWESLRDSVVPAGKLRSLKVRGARRRTSFRRATSSPWRSSRAASRSWSSLALSG